MTVLVMGHRRGLTKALEKRSIPFVVWNDKPISKSVQALHTIVADYPQSPEDLKPLMATGLTPEVVIAGTEASVYSASKVRMYLEARRNPHAVAIRCTDKLMMKEFLSRRHIPMTDYLPGNSFLDAEEIFEELGTPVVAKPRKSSGGRGIQKIQTKEELEKISSNRILLEKNIQGVEGSVESLIQEGQVLFSNITHYHIPGHCNLVPAVLDAPVTEKILELNERVLKELKIQWGLTHLEYYRTADGVLFGEVALRPPGGYIMETLELAYGVSFWDLLIDLEMGKNVDAPMDRTAWAASFLIHPGPGEVTEMPDRDAFKAIDSVKKCRLKIKIGDVIQERVGVGEDCGYMLMANDSPEQLMADIRKVEELNRSIQILK